MTPPELMWSRTNNGGVACSRQNQVKEVNAKFNSQFHKFYTSVASLAFFSGVFGDGSCIAKATCFKAFFIYSSCADEVANTACTSLRKLQVVRGIARVVGMTIDRNTQVWRVSQQLAHLLQLRA